MNEPAQSLEKVDRRGAKPGQWGNRPFEATDEQRRQVRALAQIFPPHAQHHIATRLNIHVDTLVEHFPDELARGRADMLTAVGAQVIKRAMEGEKAEGVTGDLEAQKFVLARLAGWGQRVEVTGPGGGPVPVVDLTKFTPEELHEYGRLAAIAEGLDPNSIEFEFIGAPEEPAVST